MNRILLNEWFKESKNTGLKPSSSWSRSSRTIVFLHTLSWLRGVLWYCDGAAWVSAFTNELQCRGGKKPRPLGLSGQVWENVGNFRFNQKWCCFRAHVMMMMMMMMKKSGWCRHAGLHQQSWNEAASKRSLWRSVENVTFLLLLLLLISRQTEHNSSSCLRIQTVVSSMRSHCCTRPDTSLYSVHTHVSFVLWH